MTVAEAFHRCWSGYWDQQRFHDSGWAREVQGYFRRRFEKSLIAHVELKDLTPVLVRSWHRLIGETVSTTEANRALEVLSRIFSFAEEEEIIPLGSNPCKIVKAYTEKKRDRYATLDEVRRISSVLRQYWDTDPRDTGFLFFLLLTGARPSALERARRADVADGILRVQGKTTAVTGAREVIALPDYVINEILTRVPKRRDGLIFGPGLPQRLWEKVKTEAGCTDLWARDLRRTFATHGFSSGVHHHVVGELLNHRSAQTTMIYAKLAPYARLAAANRIANGLVEAMGVR